MDKFFKNLKKDVELIKLEKSVEEKRQALNIEIDITGATKAIKQMGKLATQVMTNFTTAFNNISKAVSKIPFAQVLATMPPMPDYLQAIDTYYTGSVKSNYPILKPSVFRVAMEYKHSGNHQTTSIIIDTANGSPKVWRGGIHTVLSTGIGRTNKQVAKINFKNNQQAIKYASRQVYKKILKGWVVTGVEHKNIINNQQQQQRDNFFSQKSGMVKNADGTFSPITKSISLNDNQIVTLNAGTRMLGVSDSLIRTTLPPIHPV